MSRFLYFLALASAAACTPTGNSKPTAIIDSGAIIGTATTLPSSTATVNQYLGIPFAEKPSRFRPPQPVKAWSDLYDASKWGPSCFQQIPEDIQLMYDLMGVGDAPAGESEDCLNLNVFTPASASAASKTVMVWIHGGRFRNGANSLNWYDGSALAADQDVVVVSINYRMNVFGFPPDEGIPISERNVGLLDQRLALDWVRRNIAYLGGDPSKVTLFSESSGSVSIDALLGSPPDPLPFRAGILQSSQAAIPATVTDPATYIQSWKTLADLANCPANSTFTCLQSFPAPQLMQLVTNNSLTFNPIPDDGTTYSNTLRLDRLASRQLNSSIARLPVLIGTNADEPKPYTVGQNDTRAALALIGLSAHADQILSQYQLGLTPGALTENDRINLIATEFLMQCPTQVWANDSAHVGIPTWRYIFNASFPNNEIFPGSGAYHSAEIPYIFGTYERRNATAFQHQVGRAMQKAWADFAKDPLAGPGWDSVPAVGIIGDGVKAGMSSEGRRALRTVESRVVDGSLVPVEEVGDFTASGIEI
ncbi:Carboxylesterase [Aspergillus varians]